MAEISRRFPDCQIALIYDSQEFIEGQNLQGLLLYKYLRVAEEQSILSRQEVQMNFRKGYWRFTLERLLALNQFHQSIPSDGLMHIESDVLLLPGFPYRELLLNEKIMWCECDENRDVASIIYSPYPSTSLWLKNQILMQIDKPGFITDMEILFRIRANNPHEVSIFPTTINSFRGDFEGIFDGLNLGGWLTGMDPRNSFGVTRVRDTTLITKSGTKIFPWKSKFEYSSANGLYEFSDLGRARIWNLHIHSKNRKLLGADWENELIKYVNGSKSHKVSKEFRIGILTQLLISNYKNKTLTRYLLSLHLLKTIRELFKRGRDSH
jgi:hypothetical protein